MVRRMSWGEIAVNLRLSLIGTLLGVLAVYALFKPHLKSEPVVRSRTSNRTRLPSYNCAYRNASPLAVLNVQVDVWIRIPRRLGEDTYNHLVRVDVDDEELPWLEKRRDPQLPLLDLSGIDWARLPAVIRPSEPNDLAAILAELKATLELHVTATTAIVQVQTVHRRVFNAAEVAPLLG
jgi:hypothetical protein